MQAFAVHCAIDCSVQYRAPLAAPASPSVPPPPLPPLHPDPCRELDVVEANLKFWKRRQRRGGHFLFTLLSQV